MRVSKGFDSFSYLLDLEEFEVVHVTDSPEQPVRCFTVIPRMQAALCPCCGTASAERQQTRERTVLDLPMAGHRTELNVRVWQFRCERCDQCFTPRFAAIAEGTHATERLLERAAVLIRSSDIAHAAAFFGIPEKTLERWYYEYVERKAQSPAVPRQPIRSLGIDELSLKKNTGSSAAC